MLLTGSGAVSLAEAVTLEPVADTAVFSLNPDNNYGGLTTVPVGPIVQAGHVGRALLRFDVTSAVPRDAIVTNVTLTVRVTKEGSFGSVDRVELHRLLTDWGEGSKSEGNHGSKATSGEVNWGWRRFGSATWSNPGAATPADMVPAPSGWVIWNNPGSYTLVTMSAMVADVQAWIVTPHLNHGWLLKSANESNPGTAKRMVTREGAPEHRPRLRVEYSLPPAFVPTLPVPTLAGEALELRYPLEPGNLYELRAFAGLGQTQFTVLTNHAVKLVGVEATYREPVPAETRFYQLVITGQID